jgi:hypothetical protein
VTGVTDPGSFRDPAGFVFRRGGVLYRQINQSYAPTFDRLEKTGFLAKLQDDELLVRHEQLGGDHGSTADALAVLRPDIVPFISYPYEWCFGELRDAALLTLELQHRALDAGFILRDASAYNVQFIGGYPVFIDSLSFGIYAEGQPWQAYGQFCEHFLAPLALMAAHDPRLAAILPSFSDGIPLEIASRLLGMKTWLRPGLMLHIHAHARSRKRFANEPGKQRGRVLPLASLRRLTDHLRQTIEGLRVDPAGTTWADYETENNYGPDASAEKHEVVRAMLARLKPAVVWDLGANTGVFSAAAPDGARVIAIDGDHAAVERHYRRIRQTSRFILPLVMDLSNPSPSRGWAHAERRSLAERGPADAVLALALIHHLVLGGGVPLSSVAAWLSGLTRFAIVEFVPPDDEQVLRLVAGRTEATHPYTEPDFRRAFDGYFSLLETRALTNSARVLFLFEKRTAGK